MLGLSAMYCYIIIIAVYALFFFLTPRKGIWFPFIFIVVAFSVLAFHIEPAATDDLARYFVTLDTLREGGYESLQYHFKMHWNDWHVLRVYAYYFYFISFLPNNHFLPAITIFISYGLMFLVMYKAANRFKVCKFYLFLGTMFFLSTYWFYDTASGIRNGLVFAVITACAYYHLVERKNIAVCYICYIAMCFFHFSAVMPVALIVLTAITLNTSGKFFNFLLVAGLSIGGAGIQFIAQRSDSEFFQMLAGKTDNYTSSNFNTSTYFLVNIAVTAVVAVVIIYVSKYVVNGEYSSDLKRFYKYSSIILYFLIGCLYSSLIFMRFARWIIPLIGAFFFMVGMQLQKNQIEKMPVSYVYNAPFGERVRIRIKGLFVLFFVAFTAVHFWYACTGSSLIWMHF